MAGIEAAVESDVERNTRLCEHSSAGIDPSQVQVHRLFAKDRLAGARGGLDDRRVGARWRADDDGVEIGIGQRGRKIASGPGAILLAERPRRGKVEIDHPREPRLGMRRQVGRVHRTDEPGADETEINHGGNSPTATSSRRS